MTNRWTLAHPTFCPDMNRGRSRQVSQTAIARKASHERRAPPSTSSSPPSCSSSSSSSSSSMSPHDDYARSPSPPPTLEDQVHIAYAQDNFHLAKILLLRLKGIEVTGDNDPRIAEVQDEDFDYCFAPNGGLVLDERDEKALQEMQRLEMQRLEERQRLDRLYRCGQKWTNEKRRMREERAMVLRHKETVRAEEEERRRLKEQEERAKRARFRPTEARVLQLRPGPRNQRQVSYTSRRRQPCNSSDTDSDEERQSSFLYDYMIVPPMTPSSRRHQPTSPLVPKPTQRKPIYDDSRAVTFTEVLGSMQGPLFPLTNEERSRRPQSPAVSKARSRSRSKGPGKLSRSQVRRRKQSELFESLLAPPSSSEEVWRRSEKGKGKVTARPRITPGVCSECRRSSSSSSSEVSSPTSSAASSRPSSWLSFGSTASTSSSATTVSPSPSPRSSWFKSPPTSASSSTSPSRRGSWLSTTLVTPPLPIETRIREDDNQCKCHLTAVNLCDTPLSFDLTIPTPVRAKPYSTSLESLIRRRSRTVSAPSVTTALLSNVSQSVSASVTQLVGFAKGFQQAYVTAAMFSVAAACDGDRWEDREVAYEYDRERGVRIVRVVRSSGDVYESKRESANGSAKKRGKRPGYRVSPKDVAKFLDVQSCSSCTAALKGSESESVVDQDDPNQEEVGACVHVRRTPALSKFFDIPLGSPYAPRDGPPSTVLPNPLPYQLHFKPVPTPSRSPFRFNAFSHLHTTYPEQGPVVVVDLRSQCANGTIRGVSWRVRSVANPAYLRLKALANVVVKRDRKSVV